MYKILIQTEPYLDKQLDLFVERWKRYNTKSFPTYQEAKKYVRRLVTKLYGKYSDTYSQYGFKVVRS